MTLVCYTAVFSVISQCSSPLWGGALSDDTKNGCVADYDDSCSRPNKIMKTPALRKSKYYINTGSFRHHNNCGSTHPSMAASKENKLSPSFSGFKSQKFLHESSYDGVSGTDNDKQSLKILSKCLSSLAARSVLLI